MKRDFLKELELEDETINKIMAEHGKAVNEVKDKADKVDTLESQLSDYKQQIADRDKQLQDLEKSAKGNEELQKEIKELRKANDEKDKEYQAELAKQKKESKLEIALKEDGVKYPDLIKGKIDLDKISLDGDNLIGYEDQVKPLRESYSDVFKSEEDDLPKGLKGREPHPSDPNKQPQGITKEQFNQMGYTDRVKLYSENPDLYKQLSN